MCLIAEWKDLQAAYPSPRKRVLGQESGQSPGEAAPPLPPTLRGRPDRHPGLTLDSMVVGELGLCADIRLFMWGYQPHFASALRHLAADVFKELGVSLKPDVLLVGVLKPDAKGYPVCVEPEDDKWDLSLFDAIPEEFLKTIKNHRLQTMMYGDEASMNDKPENIRRSSATTVAQNALKPFDAKYGVRSFCGAARPVENYYVVPVIQVPNELFAEFPPLTLPLTDDEYWPSGECSLILSCLGVLLNEASRDLLVPDPGRSINISMRSAYEIVAQGAEAFMRIPDMLTAQERYATIGLFQRLNIISSLLYEGAKGTGSLILVRPDHPDVDYLVRFQTPVPFHEPRWARKILAMAGPDISLIASGGKIFGLGRFKPHHDPSRFDSFTIYFQEHYEWEFRHDQQPLLYSRYREPRLPQPPISRERFQSNFLRIFSNVSDQDAYRLWKLFEAGSSLNHGSMLVVAEDAASEAARLSDQGTAIQPVPMTPALLERVSGIDGSILVDPAGTCHAIGVILDGEASEDCSPARGSRFNSALRYVHAPGKRRMAIVFSDDRTIDIVPLLNPQIRKSEVEKNIAALEAASSDTYHAFQNWLDKHRFYLNKKQCDRINKALKRLEDLPQRVGELRWIVPAFEPDPRLDESYLLD